MTLMISESQRRLLLSIIETDNTSFNHLVLLSELRPHLDFRFGDFRELDLRGADLTGFDFTGSDLRGCRIDKFTVISESTILADADIDWYFEDTSPIVVAMTRVEHSKSEVERRAHLDNLIENYNSSTHVHLFLRRLIEDTRAVEPFFTLCDYFKVISQEDAIVISKKIISLALDASRIKNKKSSMTLSSTSFSYFIARVRGSANDFVKQILIDYLSATTTIGRVSLDSNKYDIQEDLTRFIETVENSVTSSRLL
jgi:hypothetical protein